VIRELPLVEEAAMTVAITRTDKTAKDLREASKRCDEPAVLRRLLAIALLLEGASREDAARQCGMDRQTLRDWVHRYNAEGIAGLSNHPHGGGACSRLTAEQQAEVAEWVRTGPDPEKDGVVRWRRVDLQAKIAATFNVQLHERSVGKLLRRLGFSRISVRPRHPQADASEQEAHKKTLLRWSRRRFLPTSATGRSNFGGRTRPASVNRAA
jgi:putative transposase